MQPTPVNFRDDTLEADCFLLLTELPDAEDSDEPDAEDLSLREVAFDEELIELEESIVRRVGRHVSGTL